MAKHSRSRTSKSEKKPETLWEFLNTPVGFDNFMDVLSQRIPFKGNAEESRVLPNLDKQAEELIDRAADIAQEEGITIEEALARFGIRLDDEGEEGSPSARKDSMLRTLHWQVTPGELDEPVLAQPRQTVRRRKDVLDGLKDRLSVDSQVLQEVLDLLTPDDALLRDRLMFFQFCSAPEYSEARQRAISGAVPIWYSLLSDTSRDLGLFVEVLRTLPQSPILAGDSGPFYEWLLDKGHVGYADFRKAKAVAIQEKLCVCEVLAAEAFLGAERWVKLLAEYSGLEAWKGAPPVVTKKLAGVLGREWLDLFDIAPLMLKAGVLTLGVSRPLSPHFANTLAARAGVTLHCVLLAPGVLRDHKARVLEKITEVQPPVVPVPTREGRIKEMVASASAVNLVRQLFEGALDSRASDIHIDPIPGGARVRFRIDGMLHEVMRMETELSVEVASRIKILADMDITERRRPQDGHISINIRGTEYDMRIATVPAKNGEKIAIRLVYAGNVMKPLGELGLIDEDYRKVQAFIKMPFGMILATGPVGSGKTTTLYSCLNEVDRVDRNVMSIEDPVEFDLDGANQVPVNYQLQFGFVEGLRALLRQDPDTILVGEIRDEETARIAVRASMTGLLVFSTLHTNDAPGAVTTLTNFHIPSHLIANSLVGVIAQRLLRRNCEHCTKSYTPARDELLSLGFSPQEATRVKRLYRGQGCPSCFQSGYHGRTGVFEVMAVTPALKDMILDGASEKRLRDAAIAEGMRTLARDGREKVRAGQISREEFLRILRA